MKSPQERSQLYFRCRRLAATITPGQCRINRRRCAAVAEAFAPRLTGDGEGAPPCLNCPQAAEVDAGRARMFTLAEVLAGAALREPVASRLPGEVRLSAQPRDHLSFIPEPPDEPGSLAGMRVDLYTNAVAGGWHPRQLETGLGGSEEAVILWARAVARRGARVTVYHTPPAAPAGKAAAEEDAQGVRYRPREAFNPAASRDVLVTWKDPRPWLLGARAERRIHWSSDVEAPWPAQVAEGLDAFVCLSGYHAGRLPWLPRHRLRIIPHGIDKAALEAARTERDEHCALYASSPDRGLETLLRDWPRVRERLPGLTLHVTYGWRQFEACAAALPEPGRAFTARFRARVERLLRQPGIAMHGALPRAEMHRMYWRAKYWLLPLETPDAELFCLNALKARWCGALPVIRRHGGLRDTVDAWLPYDRFAENAAAPGPPLRAPRPAVPVLDWDEVVRRGWLPLLTGGAPVPAAREGGPDEGALTRGGEGAAAIPPPADPGRFTSAASGGME